MNFLDPKELQKHAMKSRYGKWRFLLPTPMEIKNDVELTIIRIKRDDTEFDAHQARLDFIRKYPIED